jgi:hypothetical protein
VNGTWMAMEFINGKVEGNSIGEYRDDKGIVLGFVFKNMLNNKR